MKLTQRTRKAAVATLMAVAIAGGGIAVGAVTAAGPGEAARAPAATAPSGLRAGDVITTVGGTPTPDTTALAEALAAQRPGQAVTVTVARDAQELTVRLTLGELSGG